MTHVILIAMLPVFLGASQSFADDDDILQILKRSNSGFKNRSCEKSDSCSLKEFSIEVVDYKIASGGGNNFGTRSVIRYKTDSVDTLTDYAIVNFMRGCHFWSQKNSKSLSVTIPSFGEQTTSYFPEWVIDSMDKDPIYNSYEGTSSRHHGYRWNRKAGSIDKKTQVFFGNEKPSTPELYLTDRPGVGLLEGSLALNISAEFKTCIYKTKDIPAKTLRTDVEFAKPIHCFKWQSAFVYDFKEQRFRSPKKLDPICTQPRLE